MQLDEIYFTFLYTLHSRHLKQAFITLASHVLPGNERCEVFHVKHQSTPFTCQSLGEVKISEGDEESKGTLLLSLLDLLDGEADERYLFKVSA